MALNPYRSHFSSQLLKMGLKCPVGAFCFTMAICRTLEPPPPPPPPALISTTPDTCPQKCTNVARQSMQVPCLWCVRLCKALHSESERSAAHQAADISGQCSYKRTQQKSPVRHTALRWSSCYSSSQQLQAAWPLRATSSIHGATGITRMRNH